MSAPQKRNFFLKKFNLLRKTLYLLSPPDPIGCWSSAKSRALRVLRRPNGVQKQVKEKKQKTNDAPKKFSMLNDWTDSNFDTEWRSSSKAIKIIHYKKLFGSNWPPSPPSLGGSSQKNSQHFFTYHFLTYKFSGDSFEDEFCPMILRLLYIIFQKEHTTKPLQISRVENWKGL